MASKSKGKKMGALLLSRARSNDVVSLSHDLVKTKLTIPIRPAKSVSPLALNPFVSWQKTLPQTPEQARAFMNEKFK